MTFLAVHCDPLLTLASDDPILAPGQVQAFADATALAASLRKLRDEEAARLAAALAQGHQQGQAEGFAQGQAQALAEAAEPLADTLSALLADQARQETELRAAVLRVALLVVRRVASTLGAEAVLAALVNDALDRVLLDATPGRAPRTLCLHPQMLAAVRTRVQGRHPELAIEWRADAALDVLDCVIETSTGRLLAGLDAQLEHLRAALAAMPPAGAAAQPLESVEP